MQGHLDDIAVTDSRLLRIAMRRLADSLNYGVDRSPFLGSGVEFMQSRIYQHGDSIRAIDWRVTARTGKVHVKEYEAPKRLPCFLLIDTSASMTVGEAAISKYAVALEIAGGVALACLDRATPVGVVGVGQRELRIEPSLSRGIVHTWLHELRKFRYDETTTLAKRVVELGARLGNRALIVVLSDLHDDGAMTALGVLSQKHDCVSLQLRDPSERGLSGAGVLLAREAETARVFVTRGRRAWVDQAYVESEMKRSRIDHLVVDAGEPYVSRLRNFFQARDVLGRGVR